MQAKGPFGLGNPLFSQSGNNHCISNRFIYLCDSPRIFIIKSCFEFPDLNIYIKIVNKSKIY